MKMVKRSTISAFVTAILLALQGCTVKDAALVLLALFALNGGGAAPEHALEAFAPGESGVVCTTTFDGEDITYEVFDGLAVFEGDMVLGNFADIQAQGHATTCPDASPSFTADASAGAGTTAPEGNVLVDGRCVSASGWANCDGRWTDADNRARVPYLITGDWGEQQAEVEARILAAIDHWNDVATTVTLVERSEPYNHWLEFVEGDGCSSWVGKRQEGGGQNVWLSSRCSTGNAIHEIGHALGLFHEHSRDDRNGFIEVLWDNIRSGKLHNFGYMNTNANDVGAYDYGSVMHYPSWAFGKEGPRAPRHHHRPARRLERGGPRGDLCHVSGPSACYRLRIHRPARACRISPRCRSRRNGRVVLPSVRPGRRNVCDRVVPG